MACLECIRLQEEIKALRQELAYEVDSALANKLRPIFNLTPQRSEVLAVLYRGAGRTVPSWAIAEAMKSSTHEDDASKLVKVQIHFIRKVLPAGSILNDYKGGYALSSVGMIHVTTALAWRGVNEDLRKADAA